MADVYYDAQATGANNGTTKTDAYQTLQLALAATGAGDFIWASHTSSQVAGGTFSMAVSGQKIVSVDFGGSTPPVSADVLAGVEFGASAGSDVSMTGTTCFMHGCTLHDGDDFFVSSEGFTMESSVLALEGFGDRLFLTGGLTHLINTDISIGNGAQISFSNGGFLWQGGTLLSNTPITPLVAAGGVGANEFIFEGVDLSAANDVLIDWDSSLKPSKVIFKGCLLKAGYILFSGVALGNGSLVALYGSHSSNIPYFIQEQHAEGGLITETTNVKTGGSSDGTTPISMKFVTGASALRYIKPLCMALPILFYASTTGVQTFDVDIMTDGLTLQDDEAYLETSVPGTTIQRDISDSLPANPLTTPANLPLSAAVWDETGIGAAVKQTISITVDVKQVGWVEAHICFARPSEIMYADLKVLDGQRQFLAGQAYINGEAAGVPDYPAVGDVRDGVFFDSGALEGNLELPAEADVEIGVGYGTLGTEFTGTLLALTASYNLPQELVIGDDETIIYEGCD